MAQNGLETIEEEEVLPYDEGWKECDDMTAPSNAPIKEWLEPARRNSKQVMTRKGLTRGTILYIHYTDSFGSYRVVVLKDPNTSWWTDILEVKMIDGYGETFIIYAKQRPVRRNEFGFPIKDGNPQSVIFQNSMIFFRSGKKRLTEEEVQMLERQAEQEKIEAKLLDS